MTATKSRPFRACHPPEHPAGCDHRRDGARRPLSGARDDGATVDGVDELAEAAEAAAIELEDEARQGDQGGLVFFFAQRFALGELAFDEDVAEIGVDVGQQLRR